MLHLSDLHFVADDPKKARFLASLPAADVTVVTGDFLAEPAAVEATVEAVHAVRGRLASWFVLGVQRLLRAAATQLSRLLPPPSQATQGSEGAGVRPGGPARRGRVAGSDELPADARPRWAAGRAAGARRRPHPLARPRGSRRGIIPTGCGIAVMHSPDSAPETAALGYHLIVAGHTHGGQVATADRRSPRDQLLDAPPARQRPDPDGRFGAAHLPGPRHEQVRAVPVLVPPRGHRPGTAPTLLAAPSESLH